MKIKEIDINDIEILENHRTNIADTRIDELMISLKQNGLQQAIGVSEGKKKKYQIVYGQRRFLAAKKLGWQTISAEVLSDVDNQHFHILSLTENIQREDPSFNELGRSMEQLEKLGLTQKEISVRLGIPALKISQIMRTYQALPEKHREKVRFVGKGGGRKRGTIPPQLANKLLTIKKHHGLSDKDCDALFKYAQETDMMMEDLNSLSVLLKTGINLEAAIEQLHDYSVFSVTFIADKREVSSLMQKHCIQSKPLLFKRIIYGKTPSLKKPNFVKV